MKILVMPTFQRTVKKLRPNQKEELDRDLPSDKGNYCLELPPGDDFSSRLGIMTHRHSSGKATPVHRGSGFQTWKDRSLFGKGFGCSRSPAKFRTSVFEEYYLANTFIDCNALVVFCTRSRH